MAVKKVHAYVQTEIPGTVRDQIIQMLKREWPQTFAPSQPEWPTEPPEIEPVSLVIVINELIVSHCVIMRKFIDICGSSYLPFGLGSAVTKRSFRRRGFGRLLLKHATRYMELGNADIGLFTCDPHLESLYTRYGWEIARQTPLVGGTLAYPFSSSALGKSTIIHFFSKKAKSNRECILYRPIHLELGKGKLW
jgi:GNAT superfamily N-acetyltransferase